MAAAMMVTPGASPEKEAALDWPGGACICTRSPDGAKRNPGFRGGRPWRSRITLTLHPGYLLRSASARRPVPKDQTTKLARFSLWLRVRFSRSTVVDGVWVGVLRDDGPALNRVIEALALIKLHAPYRYKQFIADVRWISVIVTSNWGAFHKNLSLCELDLRFVQQESIKTVAAVIVHEATHARLDRCGIRYHGPYRERIERICLRRERAFASKLPNGQAVVRAIDALLDQPEIDLSKAAEQERQIETARYLGMPEWLIRTLVAGASAKNWLADRFRIRRH